MKIKTFREMVMKGLYFFIAGIVFVTAACSKSDSNNTEASVKNIASDVKTVNESDSGTIPVSSTNVSKPAEFSKPAAAEIETSYTIDYENFNIGDIDAEKILPKGNPALSTVRTPVGAITPLPFTMMYEVPDDSTIPVDIASGFIPATQIEAVPGNADYYKLSFTTLEYCHDLIGYVRSDKVIPNSRYAYNINETELLDETGAATGKKLAAHTLVVWGGDTEGKSTIYLCDDSTITKAYIAQGNLCDDLHDCQLLFKYKQILEAEKTTDPLLYNLQKKAITNRFVSDSYDFDMFSIGLKTGLLRKELATLKDFAFAPDRETGRTYSVFDAPYDAKAVSILEEYVKGKDVTWAIFAKPAVKVSNYDEMCYIGSEIIPAGTLAVWVKGSHDYFYVDASGKVAATQYWVEEQSPVKRNDFKEIMEELGKVLDGTYSESQAKEFFGRIADIDLNYPKYDDPNFTRLIRDWRNENYGNDFSNGVSEITSIEGSLTVKSFDEAGSVNVYSRPGTIGEVLFTLDDGVDFVPTKAATWWYSTGDDGWFDVMFYYYSGENGEGWIRSCDLVALNGGKCMITGNLQNQYERDVYFGYNKPLGPETETKNSNDSGMFRSYYELDETTDSSRFVYTHVIGFNPKCRFVITDALYGKDYVTLYTDPELKGETLEIKDGIPVAVLGTRVLKEEAYKETFSSAVAMKVDWKDNPWWISINECYVLEYPILYEEK